jgi:hypothetical protein
MTATPVILDSRPAGSEIGWDVSPVTLGSLRLSQLAQLLTIFNSNVGSLQTFSAFIPIPNWEGIPVVLL